MSTVGVMGGILFLLFALGVGWFLADLIVPQSEIDQIDAIGKWAKDELERRSTGRREE